jgi:hypothetical protein
MTVKMQTVTSSSISEIGYRRRTMNVKFNSGRTYEFKKVPRSLLNEFSHAGSKGAFFNHMIKETYPCHELV